jgi:hypothetical protein
MSLRHLIRSATLAVGPTRRAPQVRRACKRGQLHACVEKAYEGVVYLHHGPGRSDGKGGPAARKGEDIRAFLHEVSNQLF